jgi:hypothetical protein
MSADDNEIRVQLARMEGKQDVTNERLNNVQTDITDIRQVQHRHGTRLGALEADRNERVGQLKGLALSGRILWWFIGAIPVGIGAVLLKLFGA